MGERCVRNAEVEGSIPFRSTCHGAPAARKKSVRRPEPSDAASFLQLSLTFETKRYRARTRGKTLRLGAGWVAGAVREVLRGVVVAYGVVVAIVLLV